MKNAMNQGLNRFDDDSSKAASTLYRDLMAQAAASDETSFVKRGYRGGQLKAYLAGLPPLNQLQKDVLIGSLLGDSTIQYNCRPTAYLKFEQTIRTKEYVNFLYFVFAEFVGTPPRNRIKNGEVVATEFRTYRLRALDFYSNEFYSLDAMGQRKKVVPKNIHRWLNPRSLAIWFMDDGSKGITQSVSATPGYYLHTEGFILPDCRILQEALGKIFHLEVSIVKDDRPQKEKTYYKLYIRTTSARLFTEIIEPFVLPCFKYKLMNIEKDA